MLPAAVRFDRGSPTLQISNASRIPEGEVRRVVAAIQEQVDRHFFPLWGWRSEVYGQAADRKEKRYRRAIRQHAARLNPGAATASAFWER